MAEGAAGHSRRWRSREVARGEPPVRRVADYRFLLSRLYS